MGGAPVQVPRPRSFLFRTARTESCPRMGRGGRSPPEDPNAEEQVTRTVKAPARVAATLLAIAGAACATPLATGPSGMIAGTWAWVKAEGGIYPQVRTPETEGFERTLVLTAGGRAILFQDGEEVARTDYEVGVGAPGTYHDGDPVVRWETPLLGFPEQAISFPGPGVLLLDDGCCDGFVWTFHRVEAP